MVLKVSQDYINWLTTAKTGIMGHLYRFVSATGAGDTFTDLDQDVLYANILWKSKSLRFEGLQRKIAVGLSVDEQTMKIWASPTDTLFGANFLTGAAEGLLDGATIARYRIVWATFTGNAFVDMQRTPVAFWQVFTGYTAQIIKGGTSHIEVKVKSPLTKLNVNMPRNYYQPGCLWTLFDSGCTLAKASYAVNGTIDSTGTTSQVLPIVGGVNPTVGADGNNYFSQGRLLFNTGVNAGLLVLIDNNDANSLFLAYPLSALASPGDSVTFYPGCSKTHNTCDVKFNNKKNFRGFDKVPPLMLST